jgi:hypothetical protein
MEAGQKERQREVRMNVFACFINKGNYRKPKCYYGSNITNPSYITFVFL